MKIDFAASMVVTAAEFGQISWRASLLQGIQIVAASDFQRVIAMAATMVEVAIAELRMNLIFQKFLHCFIESSRRMLLACLDGFVRRKIQAAIVRTRIAQAPGFASHLRYLLLQIKDYLLWQVAAVQKLKSLLEVAMYMARVDRNCFERLKVNQKLQLQIAIVATVESFLRSLTTPELQPLQIWTMVVEPQKADFESVLHLFLRIH